MCGCVHCSFKLESLDVIAYIFFTKENYERILMCDTDHKETKSTRISAGKS